MPESNNPIYAVMVKLSEWREENNLGFARGGIQNH